MLLDDDSLPGRTRETDGGRFAFTAQADLLGALGRAVYAFMCLRWEALWVYGALTEDDVPDPRIARAEAPVLALRLQSAAHEGPAEVRLDVAAWADAFAACADLHADLQRAHPGADSLWSLPTDTPERLTLADRPADLLHHAERFEALALEAQTLRRRLRR